MNDKTSNNGKYATAYKESGLERVKRETKEISELMAQQGSFAETLGQMYSSITDSVDSCSVGKSSSKKSECPVHGGKSGVNFRFLRNGAELGTCVCHSCGTFKTGFALVMAADKCSFRDAVKKIGYFAGYYCDLNGHTYENSNSDEAKEEAKKRQQEYIERKRLRKIEQVKKDQISYDRGMARLRDMWKEAVQLDHPFAEPVRKYMVNRGLGNIGTLNGEVVCHPALEFYVLWTNPKNPQESKYILAGKFPAMLAQIRSPEGRPLRIHRTYLDWNGNKLNLSSVPNLLTKNGYNLKDISQVEAKKMTPAIPLTNITGSSIQLSEAGSVVLGVGEGLETTLAASIATGMPVNCCINAQMLSTWLPAQGTKFVFIFKDKDISNTGAICSDELRKRLEPFGIKVFDYEPSLDIPDGEKGIDWADVFNLNGVLGFPLEARNWRSLL
ncbi:hypothetical protein C9J21_17910 [Photobacterium phosphoreum]|uniref:DUF7146 domain-containing protein n=1 Tax=Photobacterium phosphoreum TaxID=659 RepID=UPI000D17791C|nr:toprim domain-containing protein [Photobacterium phosphoreum]PSW31225.1 hypothetical protein C9J21_17910 [Photobacterium phosphoreum]